MAHGATTGSVGDVVSKLSMQDTAAMQFKAAEEALYGVETVIAYNISNGPWRNSWVSSWLAGKQATKSGSILQ